MRAVFMAVEEIEGRDHKGYYEDYKSNSLIKHNLKMKKMTLKVDSNFLMVGKILISHRVTRKLIKLTKILTEDKIIVELNPGKEFDLKQKA